MVTDEKLKQLVKKYLSDRRACADSGCGYYKRQGDLREAIGLASMTQCALRKHPRRAFPSPAMKKACLRLMEAHEDLRRCRTFDALYAAVKSATRGIRGLGDSYAYEAALHVGACLRLHPKRVYFHGATRAAAKRLGLARAGESAPVTAFPRAVRKLGASRIEDFLTAYGDRLKTPAKRKS